MKRIKLLFALLIFALTFANCGHYPDGTSVYAGGVWLLFIPAIALVVGGIIVFYRSSRGGSQTSISGGQGPYTDMPSLPWWKAKWGWILSLVGFGLALTVIIVQNYNK